MFTEDVLPKLRHDRFGTITLPNKQGHVPAFSKYRKTLPGDSELEKKTLVRTWRQ